MVDLKDPAATSRYAQWLKWAVRAGLALLVLTFAADLAGVGRRVALERMPEIWSAPAATHGGVSSVVLIAIAWLASCSVVCLVPVVPLFRRSRETALAVMCVVQILVVALAAFGGTLGR